MAARLWMAKERRSRVDADQVHNGGSRFRFLNAEWDFCTRALSDKDGFGGTGTYGNCLEIWFGDEVLHQVEMTKDAGETMRSLEVEEVVCAWLWRGIPKEEMGCWKRYDFQWVMGSSRKFLGIPRIVAVSSAPNGTDLLSKMFLRSKFDFFS